MHLHIAAHPLGPALHLIGPHVMEPAARRGVVTGLCQAAGKGHVTGGQVFTEPFTPAGARELSGHHGLPPRHTDRRRCIGVAEDHAGPGQFIQHGRADDSIAFEAGHVGAVLIAHQKQDIRGLLHAVEIPQGGECTRNDALFLLV